MNATTLVRTTFTAVLCTATFFACVEKEAIVQGQRKPVDPIVAFTEDDAGDLPTCAKCGEAASEAKRKPTVCTAKKSPTTPSSTELLNALADCACRVNCTAVCKDFCTGAKSTQECKSCLFRRPTAANPEPGCGEVYQACSDDGVQ
jgi:hypothetical protein